MQGLGNSVQKGLLGEVRDDGIVDFKERAVTLCDREDLHARLGTRHLGRLFECCSRQDFASEKACRRHHGVCCHILTQEPEPSLLPDTAAGASCRSTNRTRHKILVLEILKFSTVNSSQKEYTATKLRARHLSLAEGDSHDARSNAALNSKVPYKEKWS